MDSQVVQDLRAVEALLEEGWCQNAAARDRQGNVVGPSAQAACSWCMTGAIDAVVNQRSLTIEQARLRRVALYRALAYTDEAVAADIIQNWNDRQDQTKADVLYLVRQVIWRVAA